MEPNETVPPQNIEIEPAEALPPTPGIKKRYIALAILVVVFIAGGIAVSSYIKYKAVHISTDDAYVDGRYHTVASRIPGTVMKVYVKDNQMVKKGDLLLEIDPAEFEIRVVESTANLDVERARSGETEARLSSAKAQILELDARVGTAMAGLNLSLANMRHAQTDWKRADALYKEGATTLEKLEKAKSALDVSQAQVMVAEEQHHQAETAIKIQQSFIKQQESAVGTQKAVIKQRDANLKSAKLNKSYTKIFAPADGFVTKKSVQDGNQIQPGQPLMAVVSLEDIWVTANFKETQIEKLRPGQLVKMKVDAYPKKVFEGKVESIMSGTGSVFSLFPPENASGNYVKVVQRVPVRIAIKTVDPEHILRVGLSVEPTILLDSK